MGRTLTHEEFLERFYVKNKNAENIEILGRYVDTKTKIKCRCKIDGNIFEMRPNALLKGQGCPKCYNNRRGDTTRKTHKQFMKDFMKKNKNAENIEVLEEYKNARTKIKCKCKLDGYEWEVRPKELLRGNGCPKCSNHIQLTHEEFIDRMKKANNNIEILGEYINIDTKIKCRCKIDGYEWETIPYSLLNNIGCPKCSGKATKTTKEFIKEIKKINDNIEILGEYVNNRTKIKCKCKIDNHIWKATPNNLLSGYGCPKCSSSKGEKRIAKYLDNNNIEYKEQYKFNNCKFKKCLPFDFYIPSLNTIIEYDGRQHYEIVEWFGGLDGFVDTKIRDIVKTLYCKENNIKLIRIPYWDFDNIEEILDRELEEFLK